MDLRVKVIPKSSRTELAGILDDGTWKIKVAAVPEKGKANRAVCEFIAGASPKRFGGGCAPRWRSPLSSRWR